MDRPPHLLDARLAARASRLRSKPWDARCDRFCRLDAEIVTSVVPDPLDVRERAWLLNDELERIALATKQLWG